MSRSTILDGTQTLAVGDGLYAVPISGLWRGQFWRAQLVSLSFIVSTFSSFIRRDAFWTGTVPKRRQTRWAIACHGCGFRSVRRPVLSGTRKRVYGHTSQEVWPWNVKFAQVVLGNPSGA